MEQVVKRLLLMREEWSSNSDLIFHTLPTPTTRHRCNLDVWALAQSRGDRYRSLVTLKKLLSEDLILYYSEDLILI